MLNAACFLAASLETTTAAYAEAVEGEGWSCRGSGVGSMGLSWAMGGNGNQAGVQRGNEMVSAGLLGPLRKAWRGGSRAVTAEWGNDCTVSFPSRFQLCPGYSQLGGFLLQLPYLDQIRDCPWIEGFVVASNIFSVVSHCQHKCCDLSARGRKHSAELVQPSCGFESSGIKFVLWCDQGRELPSGQSPAVPVLNSVQFSSRKSKWSLERQSCLQ